MQSHLRVHMAKSNPVSILRSDPPETKGQNTTLFSSQGIIDENAL